MDNYLKKAGDLEPTKQSYFRPAGDLEPAKQSYFRPAGDLETPEQSYFKQAGDLETPEQSYFRQAGDLEPTKQSYFKQAGDLETLTDNEIKDYLITIVSGKKYNHENQFDNLVSGGKIIVTLDKLKEMVDMGYNIITAQYINKDMIEIEFEYYKEENMRKGRI